MMSAAHMPSFFPLQSLGHLKKSVRYVLIFVNYLPELHMLATKLASFPFELSWSRIVEYPWENESQEASEVQAMLIWQVPG